MTLTDLRYIVALAQERHFGHAAEKCHVSQPTLSVAVKKLEEQLGVLLFERSAADVKVTEIGRQIVAQAERVLREASQVRDIAEAGRDPRSAGRVHRCGRVEAGVGRRRSPLPGRARTPWR